MAVLHGPRENYREDGRAPKLIILWGSMGREEDAKWERPSAEPSLAPGAFSYQPRNESLSMSRRASLLRTARTLQTARTKAGLRGLSLRGQNQRLRALVSAN